MKQRREGAYLCRYIRLNEKRNPFLADSFLAVRTGLEPEDAHNLIFKLLQRPYIFSVTNM